ncbi:MAG: RecQ family ATP-dependent DNA helicase [Ilumatobacter sp.]|uniref:RecQ family ATP-dependent DNA helicase n=3 Tax=Ilumatobacter sp. TaxID=1967498 RepID=UPI003299FE30
MDLDGALRELTGRDDAAFRDHQREAVEALVDRQRVLVVQRTGWGKSAVYFLATYLLREQGMGPTLLISPLLALMRNQIEAATRLGLRCMTVNSSSATTVDELADALNADSLDLILVSPERLANPEFAMKVMPMLEERPGMMVIDEVHCISDWGHDFRPDYRRIGRMIDEYGRAAAERVPILGCTATANSRVVDDVAEQLGAELTTFRGALGRSGLGLGVVNLPAQPERLVWLAERLESIPGSGIVYCLTIRDTLAVADWLQSRGIDVAAYSGATDADEREVLEKRLQSNDLKALVATSALGMGYDKPDLGFVIHFQMPGSPIAYYQQVGRAGRALDQSAAILLVGQEDLQIQNHFIDRAFPPPEQVNEVIAIVDATSGPIGVRDIASEVNVKWSDLESILKQLDVEGAVKRVKGQSYERTGQPFEYPTERVANVTEARRFEQQLMLDYAETSGCRMQFLTTLLDDPADDPCGICDNCRRAGRLADGASAIDALVDSGVFAAFDPDPASLERAARFLRNRPIVLAPKKMGVAADQRSESGLALAVWGDDGWGRDVERGKYRDHRFSDELAEAVAVMVRDWAPDTPIEWVTAVPSDRSGDLVPDVAARVASSLGLPFLAAVTRAADRPAQEEMANSAYQQSNVEGAFATAGDVPPGAVLLIDDLIDSGWTLTEVGRVLRRAGSGPVMPVALATTPIRS